MALPLAFHLAPQEGRDSTHLPGPSPALLIKKIPPGRSRRVSFGNWVCCSQLKVSATSINHSSPGKQPLPLGAGEEPSQASQTGRVSALGAPGGLWLLGDKPPQRHPDKLATIDRAQQTSLRPTHAGINTYLLSTKLDLMTLACLTGSS